MLYNKNGVKGMKGSCPKCGDIIDETEFTQFKGMCRLCSYYYKRGYIYIKNHYQYQGGDTTNGL